MAAISGTFLSASEVVFGFANGSLSSELNEFTAVTYDPKLYDYEQHIFGVTDKSKISVTGGRWQINGVIQQSYFDDFYNRIHLTPKAAALGNVLSSKQVEIEVWSAFLELNNLYQVIHAGSDDGLTLVEPISSPTTYRPLQALTYTVDVDIKGSFVIDSSFLFDFELGYALLPVTGNRMAIWPYKPFDSMKEQLEWNTDIIQSFDGEQRIAIRAAPRTTFSIDNYLNAYNFSIAKSMVKAFSNLAFSLPTWFNANIVPSIAANATVINVSTLNADYRVGSNAIILVDENNFEPVEITGKTDSSITVKQPISKAYTNVIVMPLRIVRALNGVSFKRQPGEITTASIDFMALDDIDLSTNSATINYPLFDGLYVLTQDIITTSNISDKVLKAVDVFDNGQGVIEVADAYSYVDRKSVATFDSTTRYSKWQLLKFLHTIKGRRGSFWIPTYNTDMRLHSNVTEGQNTFDIVYTSYTVYNGESDIAIMLRDGSMIFNHVLSAASFGVYERLTVRDAWLLSFNITDVVRISYLHKSRFDSDSIVLEHSPPEIVQINVAIKEIPA